VQSYKLGGGGRGDDWRPEILGTKDESNSSANPWSGALLQATREDLLRQG
jgi:hypothetical protein